VLISGSLFALRRRLESLRRVFDTVEMRKFILVLCILAVPFGAVYPQSYTSVPIGDGIYQLIDLAVQRGLCAPLPGSKPYTRAAVLAAIDGILGADVGRGALNAAERAILAKEREKYAPKKSGPDLTRGAYFFDTRLFKSDIKFTADAGAEFETEFAQAVRTKGETNKGYNWGGDLWALAYLKGDIGSHFSYGLSASGGILRAKRGVAGQYHTYYDGFKNDDKQYADRVIETYSQPDAYFPFTYKKKWDSSVFYFDELNAGGYQAFPDKTAGAYALGGESAAAFFNDTLLLRAGRMEREWGAMSPGGSLVFNGSARPFLALEAQFQPLSWFSVSTLTGELEYYNQDGIKKSAWTSQNAFTITMLEFNIKNFLHIDFGDAVVWPKRLELGYPIPIVNSFFYQNNIGDFDNLAIFFNVKGNVSGIMSLWFSFFDDETELQSGMKTLDRTMFAFQGGALINVLPLPFAFIKITYTKIEPYCYTHNRNFVPWYNDDGGPMETAYLNNGVGIGYYLPPNSDEILVRFETMTKSASKIHFQYQLIRHGADFGPSAVDGSSYYSELDPDGRDEKPELKKYFLHDGAYQWFHILKAGAEHKLNKLPVKVYGEAGVVFSYFTNIDGAANSGNTSPYRIVDEVPYTKTTDIIVTLGVKIFPDGR
jgi:hypothetical protein